MRTIFHVGTHKTGTTLVQRFAAANRVELRKRGLFYPDYGFPGQPGHYAHHHLARAVAGQSSNQIRPDQVEAFVARTTKDAAGADTLFLSSELAYRLAMRTGENVRYVEGAPRSPEENNWRRRAAYLTRLATALAPFKPEVLIVLRNQGDYARSLFQEQVKASRYTDTVQTFLENYRSRFDYFRQIELFREFVGPVKILIYEDLCKGPGLLENFFAALDVDIRDMKKPSGKNQSYPLPVTEFLRRLNATPASEDDRQLVIRTINGVLQKYPEFAKSGSVGNWISQQDFAAFLALFDAGNAKIDESMGSSLGRSTLFPQRSNKPVRQGGNSTLNHWKIGIAIGKEMLRRRNAKTRQIIRCLKWIATS